MTDALVIGGGLAGAALATRLAAAGREVRLLERSPGPVDKVCGEFLSSEAAAYLASLGLNLAQLGAVEIDTVRLCMGGRIVAMPLPFSALSLSRRVLDEALLERAAAAGAAIHRGMKVNALSRDHAGWSARMADGRTIAGHTAFLATGKHDLRTQKRQAGEQDDLVAFKLHLRLPAEQAAQLERHVELVLFRAGYAGLSLIESGADLANLCLVIERQRLLELGQRWDGVLDAICSESAHLEARLAGAMACWPRPLALSAIPYGYIHERADGLWRLGDQAAVIPSFTGNGMSIALHSAELAASIYLCGGGPNEYQERLAHDVRRQVRLATILSRVVVSRPGQLGLFLAARMWPGLLATTASRTRVSDRAQSRAQWSHA
jgi:flavin-dependent dehydrogenase